MKPLRVALLFAGLTSPVLASSVLEVKGQGQQLVITKEGDLKENDTACVFRDDSPISCGYIQICGEDNCTLAIQEQTEDVLIGDPVLPYSPVGEDKELVLKPKEERSEPDPPKKRFEKSELSESELANFQTRIDWVRYHRDKIRSNR